MLKRKRFQLSQVIEKETIKRTRKTRKSLLVDTIKGKLLLNEPMRKHTTFQIGGPVDTLIIPRDTEDIERTVKYAKERRIPLYVFGNGSKLLVSDKGIRGIALKIAQTLDDLEVNDERIIAGAGCTLSRLVKVATANCLSGIEFATGIPGTLGGALVMNAGTSIGSMNNIVRKVTIMDALDGSIEILTRNDCQLGYRTSVFQEKECVILETEIQLERGDKREIQRRVRGLLERRKKNHPTNKPSAGSIFKNPPDISAWKLIDSVGLGGFRIGEAEFSKDHTNFIVNLGKAKADDVFALMKLAQEKVLNELGVDLTPELRIAGEW